MPEQGEIRELEPCHLYGGRQIAVWNLVGGDSRYDPEWVWVKKKHGPDGLNCIRSMAVRLGLVEAKSYDLDAGISLEEGQVPTVRDMAMFLAAAQMKPDG